MKPNYSLLVFIVCAQLSSLLLLYPCVAVSPALKLRLSQTGINYISSVAVDKLGDVLFNLFKQYKVPDQTIRTGLVTYYYFQALTPSSYKKPQSRVVVNAGRGITLSLYDGEITALATCTYSSWFLFVPYWGDGNLRATAHGVSAEISLTLGWSSNNEPTLSLTGCSSSIDRVALDFDGMKRVFGSNSELTGGVNSEICPRFRQLVGSVGVQQLSKLRLIIPYLDDWTFDWSLVAAPYFMPGYIESHHRGELTQFGVTNRGSFQPTPFPDPPETRRMVTMWMSDWVINYFGKVLYDNRILGYTQPLDSAGLALLSSFLAPSRTRSSWTSQRSPMEVVMSPMEPPTITMPGPHASGTFRGKVAVRNTTSSTELMSIQVNVTVLIYPTFNGLQLTAVASPLTVSSRLLSSAVGTVSEQVVTAFVNHLLMSVVMPNLNVVGQRGMPILYMSDGVSLENAAIQIRDGLTVMSLDVRRIIN